MGVALPIGANVDNSEKVPASIQNLNNFAIPFAELIFRYNDKVLEKGATNGGKIDQSKAWRLLNFPIVSLIFSS